MFDAIIAPVIRQLGAARFSADGQNLIVKIGNRPAISVKLSRDEAAALVKAAQSLSDIAYGMLPSQAVEKPVLDPIVAKQEAPAPTPAPAPKTAIPAKPKHSAKK
jgi:hypothetical protein